MCEEQDFKQLQITDFFKVSKDENVLRARKERTIKKYQKDKDLAQLLEFDFSGEFGPTMNATRLERWERAAKWNLNPPQTVKKILEDHPHDEEYTKCIWDQRKLLQHLS